MSLPYLGEIRIFAGNFAPAEWAFCDGQLLQIAEYDLLFSLIGTTYGGDGQTTFALPDLRGRVPVHMNDNYLIGTTGGVEAVQLTMNQMPAHEHFSSNEGVEAKVFAQALGAQTGTSSSPATGYPTMVPGLKQYAKTPSENSFSKPIITNTQTPSTGGSQLHNNMQPYLCAHFIISLNGVYPSQS